MKKDCLPGSAVKNGFEDPCPFCNMETFVFGLKEISLSCN